MNNTNNRVIGAIIVVILIIGAWYVGRMQSGSGSPAMNNSEMTSTTTGMDMTNASSSAMTGTSVSVADQGAGKTVAISSVTLPKTGWVAIRDASGRILGAQRFEAGTNTNVKVSLLRATTAGAHYEAVLYTDNGDRSFDLHKDTLVGSAVGFSAK